MTTKPPADHQIDTFMPSSNAPQWFKDNLKHPGASQSIPFEDQQLHFLTWHWDDVARPALIFVHGYRGHAHWWSFIAPFFGDNFRIACIDLPGMGDSGHPESYDNENLARSILHFIHHFTLPSPTVIGHSYGGAQTIRAMAREPGTIGHGIIVDTYVQLADDNRPTLQPPIEKHKRRASREECIQKLRLVPPQPNNVDDIVRFIGHHSCTHDENGWYWKFDPKLQNFDEVSDVALFKSITGTVDCIYAELSIVATTDEAQQIFACFPHRGELVIVAEAHHHLMLDKPLELVATIKTLLQKNGDYDGTRSH